VTYGIDFGTTNSVLARATGDRVEVLPIDDQAPEVWARYGFDRVLPSVIGADGGRAAFGWPMKLGVGERIEAVKRLFATADTVSLAGYDLRVEEAAGLFFRHLRSRAPGLDRAVVTVPANSRGRARLRTKLAAGLAGIDVLALINEPTAAAMAHARVLGQDQRILVFDWGGGTLDVTVLQAFEGSFIEQSSKGVQRLGGLDLDAAFLARLMREIPGSADWTRTERDDFRLDLELVKVQLSSHPAVLVSPPGGGDLRVTRRQFEEAVRPLIERVRAPLEVCLAESPGRIDHLVMVGGSSRIPAVRRFVADVVGADPSDAVDPMTAVAEGAAVAAGILDGTITDLDFWVGTEHALGTVVENARTHELEMSVLIGRNTKYPAQSLPQQYRPVADFQKEVRVEVIEGDPDKPLDHEDNVLLTQWLIGLEPRPSDEAAIAIVFGYDLDGILHVVVTDVATERVMIDEQLSFDAGLDPAELAAMRERIERLSPDRA
jgi:molecular chaperone DnaK